MFLLQASSRLRRITTYLPIFFCLGNLDSSPTLFRALRFQNNVVSMARHVRNYSFYPTSETTIIPHGWWSNVTPEESIPLLRSWSPENKRQRLQPRSSKLMAFKRALTFSSAPNPGTHSAQSGHFKPEYRRHAWYSLVSINPQL